MLFRSEDVEPDERHGDDRCGPGRDHVAEGNHRVAVSCTTLALVTCKHCGTDIADNALICYRCGNATTEPRVKPPAEGSVFAKRSRSSTSVVVVVIVVAVSALAAAWALGWL